MSSEDQGDGQHIVPASLPPPLAVLNAGDCQAVRNEDLGCAICMETLSDPFVTACGHTFCYSCLTQSLQHNKHCPACSHYLTTELIFPNFLLSKVRTAGEFCSWLAPARLTAAPPWPLTIDWRR